MIDEYWLCRIPSWFTPWSLAPSPPKLRHHSRPPAKRARPNHTPDQDQDQETCETRPASRKLPPLAASAFIVSLHPFLPQNPPFSSPPSCPTTATLQKINRQPNSSSIYASRHRLLTPANHSSPNSPRQHCTLSSRSIYGPAPRLFRIPVLPPRLEVDRDFTKLSTLPPNDPTPIANPEIPWRTPMLPSLAAA